MSTLLLLSILAVTAWLALNLLGAHRRSRAAAGDSVAGFSRALDALDPANDPTRRPPARAPDSRPRPRRASVPARGSTDMEGRER